MAQPKRGEIRAIQPFVRPSLGEIATLGQGVNKAGGTIRWHICVLARGRARVEQMHPLVKLEGPKIFLATRDTSDRVLHSSIHRVEHASRAPFR